MEIIKTGIEGLLILEPRIFQDARGYFFESFSQREFEEKVGPVLFVQDNEALIKHYESADAGAFIARKEMNAIGCNIEQWNRERSE